MKPDEVARLIEDLDCGYMNCGNSEFICISRAAVDRAIAALRALTAAPVEVPRADEPFKHTSRNLRLEAQAIRKLVGQYKGVDLFWATMFEDIADGYDAAPKSAPEGPEAREDADQSLATVAAFKAEPSQEDLGRSGEAPTLEGGEAVHVCRECGGITSLIGVHMCEATEGPALELLRELLNTREAEARAKASADIAADNYHNPSRETQAWYDAMVAASEAEKRARALLASSPPTEKKEGES